jgi:hypothetical protein
MEAAIMLYDPGSRVADLASPRTAILADTFGGQNFRMKPCVYMIYMCLYIMFELTSGRLHTSVCILGSTQPYALYRIGFSLGVRYSISSLPGMPMVVLFGFNGFDIII